MSECFVSFSSLFCWVVLLLCFLSVEKPFFPLDYLLPQQSCQPLRRQLKVAALMLVHGSGQSNTGANCKLCDSLMLHTFLVDSNYFSVKRKKKGNLKILVRSGQEIGRRRML